MTRLRVVLLLEMCVWAVLSAVLFLMPSRAVELATAWILGAAALMIAFFLFMPSAMRGLFRGIGACELCK